MATDQWRRQDARVGAGGYVGRTATDADGILHVLALQAADVQDQFAVLQCMVQGDERAVEALARLRRLWRGFLETTLTSAR